jgi:hypothetical protein
VRRTRGLAARKALILLYLCLGARANRFRTNCRSLRNERSKRRGGRQGEAASEEALPVLAAVEDARDDDVPALSPVEDEVGVERVEMEGRSYSGAPA